MGIEIIISFLSRLLRVHCCCWLSVSRVLVLDSGDGRVFDVTRRLLVGALHGRSEVPPAGAACICLSDRVYKLRSTK